MKKENSKFEVCLTWFIAALSWKKDAREMTWFIFSGNIQKGSLPSKFRHA